MSVQRELVNPKRYRLGLGNPAGEVFKRPSLTVPGMTLSLQELLSRYTRGLGVPALSGTYEDDPLFDGVEGMTPQERMDFSRDLGASIEGARRRASFKKSLVEDVTGDIPPEADV